MNVVETATNTVNKAVAIGRFALSACALGNITLVLSAVSTSVWSGSSVLNNQRYINGEMLSGVVVKHSGI